MKRFGGFEFAITSSQPLTVGRASDGSHRAGAPIALSLCLFRLSRFEFYGIGSFGSGIQG